LKENKNKKKIILKPVLKKLNSPSSIKSTIEFINKVKDKIDLLYIDPSENFGYNQQQQQTNFNIKIIFPSEKADYVILNSIEELENFSLKYFKTPSTFQEKEKEKDSNLKQDLEDKQHSKKQFGVHKKVNSNTDIEEIKTISEKGANFVIIDVEDWKIIPLENIIASLQKTNTEIFALAKSVEEVETLFTVLELGVDGIIIETENEEEIIKIKNIIRKTFFLIFFHNFPI